MHRLLDLREYFYESGLLQEILIFPFIVKHNVRQLIWLGVQQEIYIFSVIRDAITFK